MEQPKTNGRSRGLLWIGAAIVLLVGIALAAWLLLRPKPLTARQVREQLLLELEPVTLKNCTLARFGGPNDGGYLMCGNLLGAVQSAYSYGIGPEDNWGCQVSTQLGVPVHQYDCFDLNQPVCSSGLPVFHAECIGPKAEVVGSRTFDTLTNQILRNGDDGRRLVVKIDVEGAEWHSLLATPDRVLDRIDQLAVEFHGVRQPQFLELVRRLKRKFHLVHLHFNNHACSIGARPLPARAYQVLFVNKRIGHPDPASPAPVLPRALDAPDNPMVPDCQTPVPEEP